MKRRVEIDSQCTCYVGCATDPFSEIPHQHEDDPCPVHTRAPMVQGTYRLLENGKRPVPLPKRARTQLVENAKKALLALKNWPADMVMRVSLPRELASEVRLCAKEEGVTASEWIRNVVAREINAGKCGICGAPDQTLNADLGSMTYGACVDEKGCLRRWRAKKRGR